ncbi:MAG: hypothetical protein QXS95_01535 [Candidatus Nitrosocaldus sp.]
MRYKKRYILAYVDAQNQRNILKMIRDAYAGMFGRKELDEARIYLVDEKKDRYGNTRGKYRVSGDAGYADVSEHTNAHRMLLPIIIRCNLEHYDNVMHILSILRIGTVTTSGTLKALRRRQGLLMEDMKIEGDEVRAAPG